MKKISEDILIKAERKYRGRGAGTQTVLSTLYGEEELGPNFQKIRYPNGFKKRRVGGDRFVGRHKYAPTYAKYLNKLLDSGSQIKHIVELGVLQGSGIAIWQNFFPSSKIYGFDIDSSSYDKNLKFLKKRGFSDENVEIFLLDQGKDNANLMSDIFKNNKISFVVDDGCHTNTCSVATFKSLHPSLDEKFLYIIEDNPTAKNALEEECSELLKGVDISHYITAPRSNLTIISNFI